MYTDIVKMDNQQGTLLNVKWQPEWEGSFRENVYMCVYGWVWNYYNIVNWLYPNMRQKD